MSIELKITALEQAVVLADPSATADTIVETAEKFYAFLSDGAKPATTSTRGRSKAKEETAAASDAAAPSTGAEASTTKLDPTAEAATTQPATASGTGQTATASAAPSDELKTAAMKFSQSNGHDAFVAALAKYGAAKLSEVPIDKRDALMTDLAPKADTGGAFD